MPRYEFALSVDDEDDLASGHKRKKEGDIVAVRPHPWSWGRKEIDEYLIVIMDSVETLDGLRRRIEAKGAGGEKNRYSIKMNKIKSKYDKIKLDKVKDKKAIYQPFKNRGQLIAKLNHVLKEEDIDAGDDPDTEIVLDLWSDIDDASEAPEEDV